MSEFKKKKNIRDVVIGDFVRQIKSTSGKKKCGEVLAILEDNVGDPTIECVEVHPDELTPEANAIIASTVWMAIWWITEAIPISVTALLPIILFPLSGGLELSETTASFGH